MPYIKQSNREVIDPVVEEVLTALRELESDDPTNSMAGNLNYLFTRILNRVYSSPRYDDINEVVGMLDCCKMEFYRRIAVPYENNKMYQNGDAYDGDPMDHPI